MDIIRPFGFFPMHGEADAHSRLLLEEPVGISKAASDRVALSP
jgi:hypothetical protein